jgi:hypothetical protein
MENGSVNSRMWNHLRMMWQAQPLDLLRLIHAETHHQNLLEASGYRSPTWRILRTLQSITEANVVIGESTITASPFFEGAGRPSRPYWGPRQGRKVILWESDEQAETNMREAWEHENSKDEMNIVVQGLEQNFWRGTEAGWIGCYDFLRETWAGDGSVHKDVMGAGSVCFQRPGCNLVVRVGRGRQISATRTSGDSSYSTSNSSGE